MLNPNAASPIAAAAALSLVRICWDDTCDNLPDRDTYVFTGVASLEAGYARTRWTMEAHACTGHMKECPDRCMLIVWYLSLFFWDTNVMDTMSADDNAGSL
jgi:hypothetical protein